MKNCWSRMCSGVKNIYLSVKHTIVYYYMLPTNIARSINELNDRLIAVENRLLKISNDKYKRITTITPTETNEDIIKTTREKIGRMQAEIAKEEEKLKIKHDFFVIN